MKASYLIEQLGQLIQEVGDLDVWIDTQYHVDRTAELSVVEYAEEVEFADGEGEDRNSTGPVFVLIGD